MAGKATGKAAKFLKDRANSAKKAPLSSGGRGVIKQKDKPVSKQTHAASSSETQSNPKKRIAARQKEPLISKKRIHFQKKIIKYLPVS